MQKLVILVYSGDNRGFSGSDHRAHWRIFQHIPLWRIKYDSMVH